MKITTKKLMKIVEEETRAALSEKAVAGAKKAGGLEEGRYHRTPYQGDDPRAQAFDQAITILDDQVFDSLEGEVAKYADEAVRALSKAIEGLEYQRNQVGNINELGPETGHEPGTDPIKQIQVISDGLAEVSGIMKNSPSHVTANEFAGYVQSISRQLQAVFDELSSDAPIQESDEEAAPEGGGDEAGDEEAEKQGGDVGNFAQKLQSSGLDEYVMKINKPDELYGLISVILKTALDSESPIGEQHIAKVLKELFKGEWA